MTNDDMALVREYAASHSEPAFATLVESHIALVYSAALRQAGDDDLAQEITQAVFILLARKARSLGPGTILSAWLYRTTRFVAADALRTRSRRSKREMEAYMQSQVNESTEGVWKHLAPLLDEAMAGLGERDRSVLVLRFFEDKTVPEIASAMQLNEDAAQKRVTRALAKLHRHFARRGVSSTAAVMAGAMTAHSVQAAPVTLAKAVTAVAITQGAAASGSTLALINGALKIMAWTKAKAAMATVAGVLLVTGTTALAVKELHQTRPAPVAYPAQADQRVLDLLGKAQAAADNARTLTADFTYITKKPDGNKAYRSLDAGTIRLMKPNFADIRFKLTGQSGLRIVSDGQTIWTYKRQQNRFSQTPADPQGKNINAWRLIIIGGFFDVQTWIAKGIYARSSSELTYAGVETVGGTSYQVLEHKVVGTISGKACPFDQKIYFGPDGLIHRFTLDCTLDGNAGSEVAELTNIKTGETMAPGDFAFTPPPGAQEDATTP